MAPILKKDSISDAPKYCQQNKTTKVAMIIFILLLLLFVLNSLWYIGPQLCLFVVVGGF